MNHQHQVNYKGPYLHNFISFQQSTSIMHLKVQTDLEPNSDLCENKTQIIVRVLAIEKRAFES